MTLEKLKTEKRNKPKFLRHDWHKKIKLGSTVKKVRKWRAAKGIHNKVRLSIKGKSKKVKIGWGSDKKLRGTVKGVDTIRIENVREIEKAKKEQGIIIGKNVGKKKRAEILKIAKEKGFKILNRFREKNAIKE